MYTWGSVTGDTAGSPVATGLDVPLPPVGQIAAGSRHIVAMTVNNEVYAWGWNALGQIGDNQPTPSEPDPTRTEGYFRYGQALAVAAAGNTSLAIGGLA